MIDEPDLAILLVAANRCLNDRLVAAVRKTRAPDVRPPFGVVIPAGAAAPPDARPGSGSASGAAAAEEPRAAGRGELPGVSRRAARRVADEMAARGSLLRAAAPADRRRTRLRLSAKGRRVRERAAAESAAIEAELRAAAGDRAVQGLRRALLAFVEREGALEEVQALRSRAPA